MGEMDVHIGHMIQAEARKKGLNSLEIQEALGSGERSISYLFNRDDISVQKLWAISIRMNYNFFSELNPVIVETKGLLSWSEIDKLFKTEQLHVTAIKIEFPVSRANDLGRFLMLLNALGLKMGFKVG